MRLLRSKHTEGRRPGHHTEGGVRPGLRLLRSNTAGAEAEAEAEAQSAATPRSRRGPATPATSRAVHLLHSLSLLPALPPPLGADVKCTHPAPFHRTPSGQRQENLASSSLGSGSWPASDSDMALARRSATPALSPPAPHERSSAHLSKASESKAGKYPSRRPAAIPCPIGGHSLLIMIHY